MGEEIENSAFTETDFKLFKEKLSAETAYLRTLFEQGRFTSTHPVGGYELEAWLLDQNNHPAAVNQEFLSRLSNPLVVPELSKFNVELNSTPLRLDGRVLSQMHMELAKLWSECINTGSEMGISLVMMGTLPVLQDDDLTMENMSDLKRYRALNEQVIQKRHGLPIKLDIQGREHLSSTHYDVMLEAAATSFQIHLQVRPENAERYFNASVLASAPLLAVSANSPYLFGKDLWAESRIPLFEQAVNTDEQGYVGHTGHSRVTFGHGWCQNSVFELFEENVSTYPVLLPRISDEGEEVLSHLRLHNGTVWRWNRPLIGIDEAGYHLRIEQRVVPAGPTITDMIANTALYYGLVESLANERIAPESQLAFSQVKNDFYAVAQHGLQAEISWLENQRLVVAQLLADQLLPAARSGLLSLNVDESEVDRYLGIIEARLASGQTGACWQRNYINKHKCSMQTMTETYIQNQQSTLAVHEWTV